MPHFLSLALLMICAVTTMAQSVVPYYRTSHALLIGINQYQYQNIEKLEFAVKDIQAVREVLVGLYGFPAANVSMLTDAQATKGAITDALAALTNIERVHPEDRVFIYFSGHGQTVKTPDGGQKGFLLPVEAREKLGETGNPADYLSSCLPMNAIWDYLQMCPAKHVLLVTDACFSGLLAKNRAGDEPPASWDLRILAGKKARQVLTAGGAGEKTREQRDLGHGIFTYKLLEELRIRATAGKPIIAQELYAALKRSVANASGGRQTPILVNADEYDGEFLFMLPEAGGPEANARLQITTIPAGATVLIDRKTLTTSPCTLRLNLGGADAKTVELGLTLAGYCDEVSNVTLERGTKTSVTLTLAPLPQTPPASGAPVPSTGVLKTNPKDGAKLIFIPAGEFTMGSPDADIDAFTQEKPKHQVDLDAYYLYKTEVTVAQYRQFCQETTRAMPNKPSWGWIDSHPIVNVSWDDAAAYAQWAGATLPTEAQWEKAARGTDGRVYPWGSTWDADKTHRSTESRHDAGNTATADGFSAGASPYGVLNLAGNVWEWCADWYGKDYYRTAPVRNPLGPATGIYRCLRGGGWTEVDPLCFRAPFRKRADPTNRNTSIGFRCAMAVPGTSATAASPGQPSQPTNAPDPPSLPRKIPSPSLGALLTNPADGADLIFIPTGEFPMGNPDDNDDLAREEKPVHTVYLDAYYIYKTEVTVAQYRKFCQATGRAMPPTPGKAWQESHPIVNVSWEDATAYAQWAGARLPTEAQWEKAARGEDGRLYPWGSTLDPSKQNAFGPPPQLQSVGSAPAEASPYGVLDMAGNATEWCVDWYSRTYYRTAPPRNPPGPATGQARVVRGWVSAWACAYEATKRIYCIQTQREYTLGFRCVMRSTGP
jgi:formylglycine-generating enzyme required for sulfatase activity